MDQAFLRRVLDRFGTRLRRFADSFPRARTLKIARNFGTNRKPAVAGPVLVDGTWHNANYWARVGYTLGALGLNRPDSQVFGLIGPSRPEATRAIFSGLGIDRILDFKDFAADAARSAELAAALLKDTAIADDILAWRLPFNYPASFFFDNLLKRQRTATVDLADPALAGYLRECIQALYAAERIVERQNWSLMLLSHALSTIDGPLAWIANRKGIPVYVLFSTFGLPYFWKVEESNWFDQLSRPWPADLDSLSATQRQMLETQGELYLSRRQQGRSGDLGGRSAYASGARDVARADICRQFGWDADKPIVAIFASNFFDFPHSFGMTSFRDFQDWLDATCAVARKTEGVNWLLRGHPVDAWYKTGAERSVTMDDLYERWQAPNVGLAPDDWNGATIQSAVDAIVTVHGTIGVEAACRGIPVLVADRGWYHDCGFVRWPKTRDDYLEALATRWWDGYVTTETVSRAKLFAGMYFCCPEWQGNFVMPDDTDGDVNFRRLPKFLAAAAPVIEREMDEIAGWIASGHRYYHLYKMLRTDRYKPSNIS